MAIQVIVVQIIRNRVFTNYGFWLTHQVPGIFAGSPSQVKTLHIVSKSHPPAGTSIKEIQEVELEYE